MSAPTHIESPDVLLIGSGVMSANLGAMLKRLDPKLTIQLYEGADELAGESSDGWNNAGTGHAGICELSYTPARELDGTVNVSKAVEIFEQFEHTKQFWAYALATGMAANPKEFISPVPHVSFVHGKEMVEFLRARFEGMRAHHFFRGMEYSSDRETIASWAPLLVQNRDPAVPIAATTMAGGTDVNFGALSRQLWRWLGAQPGCGIAAGHRVTGLKKIGERWEARVKNLATGTQRTCRAGFVFVGAGGGSLPLLQKAKIPEAKGLGGFPIGGQWLICTNPDVVAQHRAKVYGQPLEAAPTMAVPHLDTRLLEGERTLLFGPFAAWTTKFLHKQGRFTDLPFSVKPDNVVTLLQTAVHNLDLVKYLVQQGTQSMTDRMDVLRVFYPAAKAEDWRLIDAGIRVQAIKKTDGQAGIVHYGTEVITNADRTISALLGASPGASVCVSIALETIGRCLPRVLATAEGKARLKEMIPTCDEDIKLPENEERFHAVRNVTDARLQLR